MVAGLALRQPWPLPALLAWGAGWLAWRLSGALGAPPLASVTCGMLAGLALALAAGGRRRQAIAAAGFPLSAWALGGATAMPPWLWLVLLLPLLAAYPLRAWRDAPFFPTPARALDGLDGLIGTPPQRVLDAGCGLGDGLLALQRVWPRAQLQGIEWSWPLALAARLRCRGRATVQRGDMWAAAWAGNDVVYVFQRPESMSRAWAKACAELAPGAWLVSLEFALPGVAHTAALQAPGARPVWLYRVPGTGAGAARGAAARSTGGRGRR